MLLEHMGETVTLELADGSAPVEVRHALCSEADISDQSVMDVQTRFINQARYKGDQATLDVMWPKSAPHGVMGAHLVIRGERYRIYGEPFSVAHSPNGYDARLTCTRSLFLYDIELLRATRTRDQWGGWRTEWEATPTKANLLRLSDDTLDEARASNLSRLTMFELPPGTWDEGYAAFRHGGATFSIESVNSAEEVVVISGTAGA